MFTGIVTAVGTVTSVDRSQGGVAISVAAPYNDLQLGESITVDGACLTVAELIEGGFQVQAVTITRDRTTIQDWAPGRKVNLERALAVGDRFGGHIVQGHVDGVGRVERVAEVEDALLVDLRVPEDIARVSVLHGSITVSGVSLTINSVPHPNVVQVALIPYTRNHTTLGEIRRGDKVHIEGDVIGKYVAQLMSAHQE